MRIVSRVGDWPAHVDCWPIGIAIAFVVGSKAWMRIFLAMLIALALAGVTGRAVKFATGRARPSVKTEVALERPTIQFQISCLPIRSRRLFYCVLCHVVSRAKKNRRAVARDSGSDRALAHDRRRPLFVRCDFRCDSGVICALLAAHWLSIRNPQIRNPQLKERRGWDSNPRGLAPCRFSRPEPSTTRPPLRVFGLENCAIENSFGKTGELA